MQFCYKPLYDLPKILEKRTETVKKYFKLSVRHKLAHLALLPVNQDHKAKCQPRPQSKIKTIRN